MALRDYARLHDNVWYCITRSNSFSVGIPRGALDTLVKFDPEVKNYILRWLACDPKRLSRLLSADEPGLGRPLRHRGPSYP